MARCLKAVRFTTVIGQAAYNYSAMTGDNTAISATSEVEAVMYGTANIDLAIIPSEITLGATDFTFTFTPVDEVGVTILFYHEDYNDDSNSRTYIECGFFANRQKPPCLHQAMYFPRYFDDWRHRVVAD